MSTEDPTLCACGCGEPTKGRPGRPARFLRWHHNRSPKPPYVVTEAGCWEWQRTITKDGYGRTSVKRKSLMAHRVYYEQANGPIADGLQLDHLCRNRACVNPAHLEAVTPKENLRRGLGTKLTPADIDLIRSRRISAPEAVARFGIHRQYVYAIRNNRRRTHD